MEPAEKSKEKRKKKFFFVACRHAESLWNDFDTPENCPEGAVAKMNSQNFQPFSISRDPSLSKKGFEQANLLADSLAKYFESGKIKVIFVSPMRRAMQTISVALEKLINLNKIYDPKAFKIIISPLLLPKGTCPPDFPFDHFESRDVFPKGFNLDFSQVDKLFEEYGNFWFLNFLLPFNKKEGPKKRIEETLETVNPDESKDENFVSFCKKVVDFRPKYFESNPMIKKRFKAFKHFVRDNYPNASDREILLVTHNGFLKRFFKIDEAKNAVAMEFKKKIKMRKKGAKVVSDDSDQDSI